MKTIQIISLIALFFGSSAFARSNSDTTHVSVLSVKREVFFFKVDKEFLGATVEVYDSQGALLVTEKVVKRKTIIDFFNREPGLYTIKITKAAIVEEFECLYGIR